MPEEEESIESLKRRILIYRRILERYRDFIEKSESKSVADLKSLIAPGDESVQAVKERLTQAFHPYIFERDFEAAANSAFEFVRDEIANEKMPFDFWLAPKDLLELRAADEMDKSVFMCSLLVALENDSARVVVASNEKPHSFVVFGWGTSFYLFDTVHDFRFSGDRESVLSQHKAAVGWKDLEYEFSHSAYEEHAEQ